MDAITGLLKNDLAVLLLPLLLGIRGIRKKFATSQTLPTISEIIITVAMFGFGLAIAYANVALHPGAAASVTDLAWVQGILFGVALMLMDLGVDATSTRTPDAQRAIAAVNASMKLVFAGVLAVALLQSRPVQAETRPILDLSRFAASPRLVAQIYDFDDGRPRELGFAAGGVGSYSLTGRWDANASIERKFNAGDSVPVHWRESAGLDVLLPPSDDKKQWFLAFERAWYHYPGAPQHAAWVVRLQWAFGAQDAKGHDAGFAIVRGRYDVQDGRRDLGAGLQPQLIGGK